ncbi:hypothetical protein WJX81_003969 [Elliptochloris bilobata]|uniref:Uncharacterized protein n=1 Tax=Elliptochloris bilobata TaxID=381761 RepID=A0AAW1QWK6_9CHLO
MPTKSAAAGAAELWGGKERFVSAPAEAAADVTPSKAAEGAAAQQRPKRSFRVHVWPASPDARPEDKGKDTAAEVVSKEAASDGGHHQAAAPLQSAFEQPSSVEASSAAIDDAASVLAAAVRAGTCAGAGEGSGAAVETRAQDESQGATAPSIGSCALFGCAAGAAQASSAPPKAPPYRGKWAKARYFRPDLGPACQAAMPPAPLGAQPPDVKADNARAGGLSASHERLELMATKAMAAATTEDEARLAARRAAMAERMARARACRKGPTCGRKSVQPSKPVGHPGGTSRAGVAKPAGRSKAAAPAAKREAAATAAAQPAGATADADASPTRSQRARRPPRWLDDSCSAKRCIRMGGCVCGELRDVGAAAAEPAADVDGGRRCFA